MAESSINVTEGSGKRLHTFDRTISSVLVQEQATFPAEYPYASYSVPFFNVSTATANSHILQVMAGSSLRVYIRTIHLEVGNNATTASICSFSLIRLTTAGTGGTSVTAEKFDPADSAAGLTAMTLPTGKGTESATSIFSTTLVMRQAVSATQSQADDIWEWHAAPNSKGIVIAAGTSNGICIKNISAIAGASMTGWLEVVELSY